MKHLAQMRASFVTQPFANGSDLRDFLAQSLANPEFARFDAAVAWAKRSGLRLVENDLQQFGERGGHIRFVLGISEGGATAQGLRLAASLASEAYVFHVRGRTFHSKVYAFAGHARAAVLIGSHNLTRGGAVENFEAGTVLELDLTDVQDRGYYGAVRSYIDGLVADTAVCHRLDGATLRALIQNPRYRVGNEDARRAATDAVQGPNDNTGALFGQSQHQLRTAGPTRPSRRRVTSQPAPTPSSPPTPTAIPTPSSRQTPAGRSARVLHRWFKQVPRADAQRLGGNSRPSGHVTLTQATHPIDQTTYFRHTFFRQASWQQVNRGREQASVSVRVIVMGRSFGQLPLLVDHNPAFAAGQGNRSTTLRWGSLNAHLRRQVDATDQWMTLEALSDGTYRLEIGRAPMGLFIP